jgi:phosphoribosylglycinamide formyltransferase-1
MQSVVPLRATDDADTLAARVLATEHRIYPLAVRWFVEGHLILEHGVVRHDGGASQLFSAL